MSTFASDGFDLDAIRENSSNIDGATSGDIPADVVYEIGGGVTVLPKEDATPNEESSSSSPPAPSTPLDKSEEWKQRGNDEFRKGHYLEAFDLYTEAIDSFPCSVTAEEILRQRDEFNEAERERARQRLEAETSRRSRRSSQSNGKTEEDEDKEANTKDTSSSAQEGATNHAVALFHLPPLENGDKLAILYCNRAATLVHLNRYEECIQDCDVAILLSPNYTKAFVRRSAAFEKTERTEEALKDARQALQLDPSNAVVRKSVARLEKIEHERMEKLKEETMAKLKELGNSLLGNFGLSLDNFNAVQDPKTGSYSISFNQGK